MSRQVAITFIANATEGSVREAIIPDALGIEMHGLSIYANAAGVEVHGPIDQIGRVVRASKTHGYKTSAY